MMWIWILLLAATVAYGVIMIHLRKSDLSGAMVVSGTCHTDIPLKHRPKEAWVDFEDDCRPEPPSCNPQVPDWVTCQLLHHHHAHHHHEFKWALRISWSIQGAGTRRIRWGTQGSV